MTAQITLAVFASEKGPGNAARASVMSQAGTFLAKKGVRILCPAGAGGVNVPFVKSARAAGGEVLVVASEDFVTTAGLNDVPIKRFEGPVQVQTYLQQVADAYLGLPGSLNSVTSFFSTWESDPDQTPIALLNHDQAYEIVRGFAVDILVHSKQNWERRMQISDNMDDLWHRLTKMLA